MPKPWLCLHYLKLALVCALLAAFAGVAVQAILLLHAATVAARALSLAVSGELAATRAALIAEFRCPRSELLAVANSQAGAAQEKVDRA